ncbi:MAG: flagellar biosynthetic protein FliR [Candidatus Eisenbacteria bacterium]|nr:flagellar biosynthetic protein FliR [Candidatus Eisenbacteria bacterium]
MPAVVWDWLPAGLLVLFRSLGFFIASPLLSRTGVPAMVRVVAAAGIAVALTPLVPLTPPASLATLPGTVMAVVTESLLGAILGLAATLPFAGIQLAGQLMGMQMGIGLAGVMDPQTGHQGGIMGRMLELVALTLFLLADGHHILLRALAFSLKLHPPGTLGLQAGLGETLIDLGAAMFVISLEVGGAVLGVLFLAETAMGFVARTVPQMNIFIVGFPAKIALGLATLALTLPLYVSTLNRIFAGMEDSLLALLRGM